MRVPAGTTVFDGASWNGIAIDSTCGGHGTCKKCKVRITSGEVPVDALDPRAFSPDELRGGWRLACRAIARHDLAVDVPPLQTRPKAALVGVGRHVILRPAVQKRYLELEEPSLEDQTSDLERVVGAVDDFELRVELGAARNLGRVLRAANYKVTAVICDDVLLDVEPGDTSESRHAIAFDLGTTTVVATLLDLATGQPLAVRSMLNRQQPFGADVISRVSATMMDPDALEALQQRAHETMNQLATEVCEEAGLPAAEVYEIVVCGNVTMMQLALGIDPEPLGMSPFIITARRLPPALASDFGVRVHPRAPAAVFPALGAYVGGDIVAGMLATGLTRDRRVRLFIDVGTNSEIALGSSERVVATAAPAGPAFEAAQIRCGMRAAEGAIEGVAIKGDELALEVIGDAAPVGMCGSGLVDAVAQLVACGLLDHSGRFIPDEDAAAAAPRAGQAAGGGGRGAGVRAGLARRRPRERHLPVSARRPRAAVRQGLDRHRLADPDQAARHRRGRDRPGAAGRQLRLVSVAGQRRQDRPGAQAGAAAHRLGRQRCRRGRQDGRAVAARAGGRRRHPGRRRVRGAVGPGRLQRHVHGRAGVPRMSTAVVACGALTVHIKAIAGRRGWQLDVYPLPPELHNRPERIAPAVDRLLDELSGYRRVAVAYADCGSYGALDRVLRERGVERLAGDHCYDVFGRAEVTEAMAEQPGTYFLTDFLARTFERTVWRSLGLDRHPELRDDYFHSYTRVLWLAQRRTPELEQAAGARPPC